MPVAHEICFKKGAAPILLLLSSPACGGGGARQRAGGGIRTRGANEPACFGGARFWLGHHAQEKSSHAGLRRGEHEPAARGEIEDFRRARDLDHDGAERFAGERVQCRAQGRSRIVRAQQKHPRGIKPQFQQAERRKLTFFERGEIWPQPQHVPLRCHAGGKRYRKAARRSLIPGRGRVNLVQGALLDAALEAGIGCRMAQRHARMRFQPVHPRERRTQERDFFRRSAHDSAHGPTGGHTRQYGTKQEHSQEWRILKNGPLRLT